MLVRDPAEEGELLSPDKKWAAILRDHNLWVRDLGGGEEFALTNDGELDFAYGTPPDLMKSPVGTENGLTLGPLAVWSPDSSKLITHQLDHRDVRQLFAVQAATPGGKPVLHSWRYPMVGDQEVPLLEFVIADVIHRQITPVRSDPIPASYCYVAVGWLLMGGRVQYESRTIFLQPTPKAFGRAWWAADSSSAFILFADRGDKSMTLAKIDPSSGGITSLPLSGSGPACL